VRRPPIRLWNRALAGHVSRLRRTTWAVAAITEALSMHTIRPSRAAIPLLLVSLLLAACAGSAGTVLSPVGDAVDGRASGAGTGSGDVEAPAAMPSGAPLMPQDGVGAVVDDAKIIRTGTIDLEVSDVPKALTAARDGIRAMGGYIGASQTFNEGDTPVATITYRIPADRWEDALDLLRGLNGLTTKVVTEQSEAVEVTSQVIDLEARIANLRASEAALQEIARKAVRVSDVLEVQAQLTAVRGEIEQLTAQLKDLEDRAAMATLTARFSVPVVAVEVAQKGWDPTAVVDEATASLVEVLQGLATAGIWFGIVWLPILLVLGVIAAAFAWIVRRTGIGRRPKGDVATTA
jgi:cell division protein FtsB